MKCPRRDLNPCYRRERPVSWAGLDDGDVAEIGRGAQREGLGIDNCSANQGCQRSAALHDNSLPVPLPLPVPNSHPPPPAPPTLTLTLSHARNGTGERSLPSIIFGRAQVMMICWFKSIFHHHRGRSTATPGFIGRTPRRVLLRSIGRAPSIVLQDLVIAPRFAFEQNSRD